MQRCEKLHGACGQKWMELMGRFDLMDGKRRLRIGVVTDHKRLTTWIAHEGAEPDDMEG